MMESIQSGVSAVVSVVLIRIPVSEALASQTKARSGTSARVQSGSQTHTQRRRVGVAGTPQDDLTRWSNRRGQRGTVD